MYELCTSLMSIVRLVLCIGVLIASVASVADDHGNSIGTATAIALPSTTNGHLGPEPGDTDFFRIRVGSPTRLVIQTEGETDTFGRFRRESGRLLDYDDDSGASLNFRIQTDQLARGIYYIAVSGYNSSTTVGDYRLIVQSAGGGPIEPDPSNVAQAPQVTIRPVPVGDEQTRVQLNASLVGGRYDGLASHAWSVSHGTLDNPSSESPLWTRPAVNADLDVVISLTLTVRGDGTRARNGTQATANVTRTARVRASGPTTSDDHGDTVATATNVAVPSTTNGMLTNSDHDVFQFRFAGGRLVLNSVGDTDTFGTLLDENGVVLADNDDGGSGFNFRIDETNLSSGIFYVVVRGYDSQTTGSYSLRVQGSNLPVATVPNVVINSIPAGNEGEVARLSARLTGGAFDGTPEYSWSASEGTLDAANSASPSWRRPSVATNTIVDISLTLSVRGDGTNARNGTRDFVTVTQTANVSANGSTSDDDHGDSLATATNVAVPSTTSGTLSRGDNDVFQLSFGGGQLTLYSVGNTDTFGTLLNEVGSEQASNDDGGAGLNFRIVEQNLPAGTYYLVVRGYDASTTGSYTLHVEEDGGGRTNLPNASAPNVAISAIPAGNEGESVQLGATLSGGTFDGTILYSWSVSAGTLDSASFQNPSWQRPTVNSDRNVTVSLTITVRGSGTHARSGTQARVSASRIARVLDIPTPPPPIGDDHGDSRATATTIAIPSTTNGRLDEGDHDYFTFRLSRTTDLRMETTGSTDTFGILYTDSGNTIATNDDSGAGHNFRITAGRLSAGRYIVLVRGYDQYTAGAYSLRVRGLSVPTLPDARPPALTIDPIPDGPPNQSAQLSVGLSGGFYDGVPEYSWSVSAGSLDAPTAATPIWTRPSGIAERQVTIQVQVTVRGEGTNARDGSTATSSRVYDKICRHLGT